MIRTVRHMSCATFTPRAARLGLVPDRLVAHCLLLEEDSRLTLVDTGFGTGDVADPARLGRGFAAALGVHLDRAETALEQLRALGHRAEDVTDIVLTHLDLDHAGGIGDFPGARVHVLADELAAARRRRHAKEKGRYVPAQWAHGPRWVEHRTAAGDDWFGVPSVPVLGEDVRLVPLPGHTRGHAAVAVRRPSGGWFLHAGDAYFWSGELSLPPTCPAGLRLFQSLVQTDAGARRASQERLRELHARHAHEVTVFSAHDAGELAALAGVTD
jgi:glyoxylase-like metal-dependent hydrolase (beta-lactamase superfamily II)